MKKIDLKELNEFIRIADLARKAYCGSKGTTNRKWYEKQGISKETIDWLIAHHYASQKPGKSLWIAFENRYHPEKTIGNLSRALELAEQK